ncbi:MAG: hypothetical protein ABWY65_07170 [Thermoleophilaceae bacterium]
MNDAAIRALLRSHAGLGTRPGSTRVLAGRIPEQHRDEVAAWVIGNGGSVLRERPPTSPALGTGRWQQPGVGPLVVVFELPSAALADDQ